MEDSQSSGRNNLYKLRLIYIVRITILVIIGKFVLDIFLVQTFLVQSNSMRNSLVPGDRIAVCTLYPKLFNLKRGDIILFKSPINDKDILVKRVVGLPLEELDFFDGKLVINESKNIYPHKIENFSKNIKIYKNQYFVLGDNLKESVDSRFFGLVNTNKIIGKVVFRYFPPGRFGAIR